MAQIEKLSLEQQVIFYREATISLRDKLKSALPILQAHDSKFCYLVDVLPHLKGRGFLLLRCLPRAYLGAWSSGVSTG